MEILLVEDVTSRQSTLNASLQQHGIGVTCAYTLAQARAQLKQKHFDGILLDLVLPDSSGILTLMQMRETAIGVPIIVFTDEKDKDLALRVVKHGAQDCLVKDVVPDASVLRCLRYAVERNKVELELHRGEERLRTVLENSYDAFISMDSRFRITDWNSQAEIIFGRKKSEVMGRSMAIIIPHHLRRQYLKETERSFANNEATIVKLTSEITAVHSDGHEFPLEIGFFKVKEDTHFTYCAFARDITERQKFHQELERLVQERTERLTRSNEELKQFAKVASHDLQEPLRAVQGFANLLAESAQGKLDKDQQEFIEYILDGTARMQNLIRAVLLHSESSNIEAGSHCTNCGSVMTEVMANLKTSISETGTTFEIDKLPDVAVQRLHVVQLFQNLISNAIKYRGPQTPQISITTEENAGQWLFSFRDNGIGIDPQYSHKIFDMFARLHGKGKYPGTGMGLAICKRIVTSHGGNIWVESTPGDGSIFFFTLPAARKARRIVMNTGIEILLVEDTPSDVRLTQEALKRSDLKYELNVVNDGVEAMEYLHKIKEAGDKPLPDVILLDLNMPRKNGHEVLQDIKNDPVLRTIPVVLLTVSENDEDVMEALKLKMNYYIAKPITAPKLSALLNSIHQLHKEQPDAPGSYADDETHIRLVLASNHHTASVALTRLADDPNEKIRIRVAENPHTPAGLLIKLASDPCSDVRLGVSENPNAPESVLEELSKDQSEDVRMGLATNNSLPQRLLDELAKDDNIYVSSAAQKTLSTMTEKVK